MHALHRALRLRHRGAGQGHRRRGGQAGRQELVLPDRRLRVRRMRWRTTPPTSSRPRAARWSAAVKHPLIGIGLLVLPAAGAGVQGADPGPGQCRRRHHQRDQGGQRIRHHQDDEAGRPADVHQRHPLAGPEPTQGMYLTDSWYWDQNDETRAWAKRFFEKMKSMPIATAGRRLLGRDDLPEGGQGDRHRRCRQGHGADEEDQDQRHVRQERRRSAPTAAWCTTCT